MPVYHTFDSHNNYLGITDEQSRAKSEEQKVSVIVPIFNVERFLDQALTSIRSQIHKNLEIICINDGSTDGSLNIVRRHAADDGRIQVVDKPNEGYGAACNLGLDMASGDWISIVEPDDWINDNMYSDMLDFASSYSDIDIIKAPYFDVEEENGKERIINCNFRNLIDLKDQPFSIDEQPVLIGKHPSIWSALYSKRFIDDNDIRFPRIPGAGWADNPFFIETMCLAKNILWVDVPAYNYRVDTDKKRERFLTGQFDIPFDRWNEMTDILESIGITDEGVLKAHYRRAFVYAGQVLEFNNVEDPEIEKRLKRMFERMDPGLVFDHDEIQPGMKRLFAQLMDMPSPKIDNLAYMRKLGKDAFSYAQNVGIRNTIGQIGIYIRNFKKRTGAR